LSFSSLIIEIIIVELWIKQGIKKTKDPAIGSLKMVIMKKKLLWAKKKKTKRSKESLVREEPMSQDSQAQGSLEQRPSQRQFDVENVPIVSDCLPHAKTTHG
jgi:hypothetical protein